MGGKNDNELRYVLFKISALITIYLLLISVLNLTPLSIAFSTWTITSDNDFKDGDLFNITIKGNNSASELSINTFKWLQETPQVSPPNIDGFGLATVHSDDTVMMFGGAKKPNTFYNETWIYDHSENIWTYRNQTIKPRASVYHELTGIYGTDKVVMFSGLYNVGTMDSETWIYHYNQNLWENVTTQDSPVPRVYHGLAHIYGSDKVLLYGGYDLILGHYDDTWLFDLNTNTWNNLNMFIHPSKRGNFGLSSVYGDDKIVLFGGHIINGINEGVCNETWIFDLSDNRWIKKKVPMRAPRELERIEMAPIYGDDKVVMFGGEDGDSKFDETWIYDVSENRWTQIISPENPIPRYNIEMAAINSTEKVLLFGGNDFNSNRLNDTWLLTPHFTNGTYVSRPFEIEEHASFKKINWNSITPTNTLIRFQVRTADTNQSLQNTSFTGPDGSTNSFYLNSPSNIWTNQVNVSWLQFKAYFISNDFKLTPRLQDVTISYNLWPETDLIYPNNNSFLVKTKPTFNWTFNDPDSVAQVGFQVLIDDDMDFNNIEFDSGEMDSEEMSYQFSETIPDGKWYWKVRTKDSDGDWGIYSDPFKFIIDTNLPTSNITYPENDHFYKSVDTIYGEAFDAQNGAGLKQVQLNVQNTADSSYWNGSAWISTKFWLKAVGSSNWSYDSSNITWTSDVSYKVRSWALDSAENFGVLDGGITFTIDREKPVSNIFHPVNDTWINRLDLITGQVGDANLSGVGKVELNILRPGAKLYWNGEKWTNKLSWLDASGNTSWTYNSTALDWWNGYEYIVSSRAIDNVGNVEELKQGNHFKIDNIPPTKLSISINNGSDSVKSPIIFLSLEAKDTESGLHKMSFSLDGIVWSPWQEFKFSIHYSLPVASGNVTVYYRVIDKAGNIAEPVFASIYKIFSSDTDSDGDLIPDLVDAFPDDPAASVDTDDDNYPDYWNPGMNESNSTTGLLIDAFPNNSTEWLDTDGDGVGNNSDAFPEDPAASVDSDGDQYPDDWNPGKSEKDSTTGLKKDDYPNDPDRHTRSETSQQPFFEIILLMIVILVLFVVAIITTILRKRKRKLEQINEPYNEHELLKKVRDDIVHNKSLDDLNLPRDELKTMLEQNYETGAISKQTYEAIKADVLFSDDPEVKK